MGLLPTTGICWYANMAAMAKNRKLYFIKSDKVQAVEKLSWKNYADDSKKEIISSVY